MVEQGGRRDDVAVPKILLTQHKIGLAKYYKVLWSFHKSFHKDRAWQNNKDHVRSFQQNSCHQNTTRRGSQTLKVVFALPVASATSEHTFSALWRLKNYLIKQDARLMVLHGMLNVAPIIPHCMFCRYLKTILPWQLKELSEWFYSDILRDTYRCVTRNHTRNNSTITSWPRWTGMALSSSNPSFWLFDLFLKAEFLRCELSQFPPNVSTVEYYLEVIISIYCLKKVCFVSENGRSES